MPNFTTARRPKVHPPTRRQKSQELAHDRRAIERSNEFRYLHPDRKPRSKPFPYRSLGGFRSVPAFCALLLMGQLAIETNAQIQSRGGRAIGGSNARRDGPSTDRAADARALAVCSSTGEPPVLTRMIESMPQRARLGASILRRAGLDPQQRYDVTEHVVGSSRVDGTAVMHDKRPLLELYLDMQTAAFPQSRKYSPELKALGLPNLNDLFDTQFGYHIEHAYHAIATAITEAIENEGIADAYADASILEVAAVYRDPGAAGHCTCVGIWDKSSKS